MQQGLRPFVEKQDGIVWSTASTPSSMPWSTASSCRPCSVNSEKGLLGLVGHPVKGPGKLADFILVILWYPAPKSPAAIFRVASVSRSMGRTIFLELNTDTTRDDGAPPSLFRPA